MILLDGRDLMEASERVQGFEHGVGKKLRATRWVELRLSNCTAECKGSAGGM
jgi:hypothetical protein